MNNGVALPESIADHMYRMSMMAFLVQGKAGVDVGRCIRLAIVHDVAESLVGDITPHDGVSDADKHALEAAGIAKLQGLLQGFGPSAPAEGDVVSARELKALWDEYEAGTSPEARLVKDFDKLEMILQALEYETTQGKDLQSFFDGVRGKWKTDLGRQWAAEIERRREEAKKVSTK